MIAILGGTFNPIHNGHLYLADQLQKKLNFSAIRFMPAAIPALKDQPNISAEQRAEMVELAIKQHPHFTLDTRELKREGNSYTIDSLISLRQELGEKTSLCWLMGADAFAQLNQWHRWQALLNYAHLIVVHRPHSNDLNHLNAEVKALLDAHATTNIQALAQQASGKILVQEIAALDISSTQIREQLNQREAISQLIPAKVLNYIHQHHLYEQ